MRPYLIIIMGFVILIGGSLFIAFRINTAAEMINSELNQAESLIVSDNWEEASITINNTYDQWTKLRKWWAVVVNHNTLNSIEVCYLRLEQFARAGDKPLSLAELNALMFLLHEIPESETLKLINVF